MVASKDKHIDLPEAVRRMDKSVKREIGTPKSFKPVRGKATKKPLSAANTHRVRRKADLP